MNDRRTVVDTYIEVGIARNSYYYIVKKNPQSITDIQAIKGANNVGLIAG